MVRPLGTNCQDCVQTAVDDHTARRIEAFYLQSAARTLLPRERVADCLRKIVPGKNSVDVALSLDGGGAHLMNLCTCSRIWQCPVCASRISSERAQELMRATSKWHDNGSFCALFTYTLSHIAIDPLTELLGALREAHRAFKSGRWFQDIKAGYFWRGSVSALETTYGKNGWHPHIHELVFFDAMIGSDFDKLEEDAKEHWRVMVAQQKQMASWTHGLDIRETDTEIYEYVSKYGVMPKVTRWTAEAEVTRAPVKRSSKDGITVWQILSQAADGNKASAKLFLEYSAVFKGRNQLVWSKGLKSLLGIDEKSDEEIIETEVHTYLVLQSLSREEWKLLMRLDFDVRGEILKIASLNDPEQLKAFIQEKIDLFQETDV